MGMLERRSGTQALVGQVLGTVWRQRPADGPPVPVQAAASRRTDRCPQPGAAPGRVPVLGSQKRMIAVIIPFRFAGQRGWLIPGMSPAWWHELTGDEDLVVESLHIACSRRSTCSARKYGSVGDLRVLRASGGIRVFVDQAAPDGVSPDLSCADVGHGDAGSVTFIGGGRTGRYPDAGQCCSALGIR
jgi:hypothetical protein